MKWYHWKIEKILLFDDSYEHKIQNDTDQVHIIVLLIRFFHPLLSRGQQQLKLMEARRQKELAVEKESILSV